MRAPCVPGSSSPERSFSHRAGTGQSRGSRGSDAIDSCLFDCVFIGCLEHMFLRLLFVLRTIYLFIFKK